MPELFDVIEVIADVAGGNVRAGMQGAIVEKFSDTAYLVEFANEYGETLELLSLTINQFIVVWHNATHEWVPIAEQAAAIIARLPKEAAHEVLDFARFLAVRTQDHEQQSSAKSLIKQPVTA